MKFSSSIRNFLLAAVACAIAPASAYTLAEQITTSGYQSGDVFTFTYTIAGYSGTGTRSLSTLDQAGYYILTQQAAYLGLASDTQHMRNDEGEDPGRWPSSTLVDGVNTYSSDGCLSRDADGKNTAMSDLSATKVAISSNGTNSSTISFVASDRSSSVTLNNVVLDAGGRFYGTHLQ